DDRDRPLALAQAQAREQLAVTQPGPPRCLRELWLILGRRLERRLLRRSGGPLDDRVEVRVELGSTGYGRSRGPRDGLREALGPAVRACRARVVCHASGR